MMEIDAEVKATMKFESLAYSFFGNNLIIGSHIRRQLTFLKEIVPVELQHRDMDDLGCGDGKVTILLEGVFWPSKLRGFDISSGLVRRARSRGIDAEIINLDEDMPHGELAVMWGVLHHLQDPGRCLRRLKENYPLIFIREPVKTGFINGLELGHPMRLKELTSLFNRHLPDFQIHYCDNSVLVLYACPDYIRNKESVTFPLKSLLFPELSTVVRC
jgi:SAM-dependent methyltransferase